MATVGEVQDSVDQLTIEISALKKKMEQNSEAIANLGNLREEVEAVVLAGARDSVTAINSGIQKLQDTTKENLQKAVKAVEQGVQKNDSEVVTRKDVIAWAVFFLFGMALCFSIIRFYTVELVTDNFNDQIKELAEEPRKEAEKEAKRIIAEAQKQAKIIIQEAEKKGVDK